MLQSSCSLEQRYIFFDSQLRVFGGYFKTVEKLIETLINEAHLLPSGWHIRLKEHPNSQQQFERLYKNIPVDG